MPIKMCSKSRQEDIVIQEFDNEILIYNLKTSKAYCLNKTSSLVWQACDGKKSVSEISEQLSRKLKSQVSEEFVFYALEELKENDLLTHIEAMPIALKSLSRREMIHRVGLASMVAMPIITSLVAPTAAQAASGGGGAGVGQSCTGGIGVRGSCQAGLVCCDNITPNSGTCQTPDPSDGACGDITP